MRRRHYKEYEICCPDCKTHLGLTRHEKINIEFLCYVCDEYRYIKDAELVHEW